MKSIMDRELENAFLEGLEDHKHKLLRICSVYAKDEEERKDLFQEALVNVWKSMPSFQSNSSLGTWMYRVTLNVCLSAQTRLANNKRQFVNMDSVELSRLEGHEDRQQENPLLHYLKQCLKLLNEADKAVMTLYLEELPYIEIGQILGISENNVAVKVKRIKKKLLNCINERS